MQCTFKPRREARSERFEQIGASGRDASGTLTSGVHAVRTDEQR